MKRVRGYQAGYLIGFIIIAVVVMRDVLFFQSNLPIVILHLLLYSLFYILEPWLSNSLQWYKFVYFPMQTAIVISLTNLRPFTDISSLLYVPLSIQAVRTFSRRSAVALLILFTILLSLTQILGIGWLEGLALVLTYLAVCAFLISYDFLYFRTQADREECQRLLAELQAAHRAVQLQADQTEELAAARERNRLARELHDSVNQSIFSITLTSRAARLLLEREPARVPEQLDRLQTMTGEALSQLRTLIEKLRPPQIPK
jgi:signal transduction histidine kinase